MMTCTQESWWTAGTFSLKNGVCGNWVGILEGSLRFEQWQECTRFPLPYRRKNKRVLSGHRGHMLSGKVRVYSRYECCVLFLHVNLVITHGARGLRCKPPIDAICVIWVKALNGSDPVSWFKLLETDWALLRWLLCRVILNSIYRHSIYLLFC